MKPFMDFYPCAERSTQRHLWKQLHNALGVELEAEEGKTVSSDVTSGKFKGFVTPL